MRRAFSGSRVRGGLLLAMVGTIGSILFPSASSAGWTEPVKISGIGSSVSQTRTAGMSDGSAWVVWKRDIAGIDVIQGTRVSPEGVSGPVQTISTPLLQATDPVLATRADGSAMVAWLNLSATAAAVHSRSIAADGTFGPIKTRSGVGPVGQPARDISLSLGADGSAGIAWRKFNGTYWVAQATMVAGDGTSSVIHDLSEPSGSARSLDIAAEPPAAPGGAFSYRAVWAQGTGSMGNVYTRGISPEDTVDQIVQLLWPRIPYVDKGPVGPGVGGAPHDVNIAVEDDGTLSIAWIRYRTDYFRMGRDDATSKNPFRTRENGYETDLYDPNDPDDLPYENWAIEAVRKLPGPPPFSNTAPQGIFRLTPAVEDVPYDVENLQMFLPHGGEVLLSWVHDLNRGGERVETGRYLKGLFRGWVDGATDVPTAADPVVMSNGSSAAMVGWVEPAAQSSGDALGMRRFSDTAIDQPFSPAGGDIAGSRDPGFVVADDGVTQAFFTAIDGQGIGSVRTIRYTNPGLRLDTKKLVFGQRDMGQATTLPITIRSSGETPIEVTDIALAGPDSAQYQLDGATDCIREYSYRNTCTLRVRYTPGSTATHAAKVTITHELGVDEVDLSGSGASRTRNLITIDRLNYSAKKGRVIRIRAVAENRGGVDSGNTRICVNLRKRALQLTGARCRSMGTLAAGGSETLDYRILVKAKAPKGVKLPVAFVMSSDNSVDRKVVAQVRRVGR